MLSYEDSLHIIEEIPGFRRVYASLEDGLYYYFLVDPAVGNPFYRINKYTGGVDIISGAELQKKRKLLRQIENNL